MMFLVSGSSMITRVAMVKMLDSSCDTTTMVVPRLRLSCTISSSSSAEMTGSRPADGSSKNRMLGSSATARASAARFFMPPESSAGSRPSAPVSFTMLSFMRTSRSMVSRGNAVYSCRGSATFSPSVIEPNSAPPWKVTPIRCWMRRSPSSSSRVRSSPSMKTRPLAGRCRPIMWRSSVVLPQPDPPTMTNTSPRRTSHETSLRMTRSPYLAVRRSTRIDRCAPVAVTSHGTAP